MTFIYLFSLIYYVGFCESCHFLYNTNVCTEDGRKSPITAQTPITPLTKKALTHLVQSPGTQTPNSFARQPTLQRMHYNIPHRFEQKICMRISKCTACLDSINFGQYSSTCRECGTIAHPKVSYILCFQVT